MSVLDREAVREPFDARAEAHLQSLFRRRPPEEFLAELDRYAPTNRSEVAAHEQLRGWALLDQGEADAARTHLTRALRASRPGTRVRAMARGLLAEIAMRMGRFHQVERLTHRALADLPADDPGSYLRAGHMIQMARACRRQGHVTHAIATLRRVLAMLPADSPHLPLLMCNLAHALLLHGELEEVEHVLRTRRPAAEADGPSARVWLFDMERVNLATARREFAVAEELLPSLHEAARASGERSEFMIVETEAQLACAKGEWARAEAVLRPILQRARWDGRYSDFVASCSRMLAEALLGKDRLDEAMDAARAAIRAGSREDRLEWCEGLRVLGQVYARLGRSDEARRTLLEALVLHERFQFHLAQKRLRETIAGLGLDDLLRDGGGRNGAHAAGGRDDEMPAPVSVRLRDGRTFLTCDRALLQAIELAASSQWPALIEGETGTGKELVARLLHELGPLRSGPFVVVDCASLPAELADSELFGAARGAYTGASSDRAGLVSEADGGTLFLDELPELPLALQAKLLRTLQDGTYRRVGEATARRARVRVVAATNRPVDELVRSGAIKSDLFYRLNGHRLKLEPLHRRRAEIRALAESVVKACGLSGISPAALAELRARDWPGNVRQLELTVRVAACRVPTGQRFEAHHLDEHASAHANGAGAAANGSLKTARAEWERHALQQALRESDGVVAHAARSLGMTRQAFYKAMRRCGLDVRGARHGRPTNGTPRL